MGYSTKSAQSSSTTNPINTPKPKHSVPRSPRPNASPGSGARGRAAAFEGADVEAAAEEEEREVEETEGEVAELAAEAEAALAEVEVGAPALVLVLVLPSPVVLAGTQTGPWPNDTPALFIPLVGHVNTTEDVSVPVLATPPPGPPAPFASDGLGVVLPSEGPVGYSYGSVRWEATRTLNSAA